jgi:hypothetical protein
MFDPRYFLEVVAGTVGNHLQKRMLLGGLAALQILPARAPAQVVFSAIYN